MSVFDEGTLNTNTGKVIDFSKAIIIATTNAGCEVRGKKLGFGLTEERMEYTTQDLADYFDVEMLNRFNYKYTFQEITKEIYKEILIKKYESELEKLHLDMDMKKWFCKEMDKSVLDVLVASSYDIVFGARTVETVVTEYMDTEILRMYERKCA